MSLRVLRPGSADGDRTSRQAAELKRIYPDHCLVIVQRAPKCTTLPTISRSKKMTPQGMTVGEFKARLQKELKLPSTQTFMIMIGNQIPTNSDYMGRLHEAHKNSDNVMRVVYCEESFYG